MWHYGIGPAFLEDEEGGSRALPPLVALGKERTIPLGPHFRENVRRTCICDRIGHSVRQNRKGSGSCGKTDPRCEIRGICWVGRSWTKVLDFAHGCPGDVKCRRGVVDSGSTKRGVVDCALFGQMEARRLIAHEERIVWNGNNPEQT